MPVILRHNKQLELSRVDYARTVSMAELGDMAKFFNANPRWVSHDTCNLVLPGAEFSGFDRAALDQLFARYANIYAPLTFQILRRSAWLCQSEAARDYVQYWVGDRDVRTQMSSDVRLFDTFAAASEWLLLSASEAEQLQRGEGFDEIARFHAPQVDAPGPSR